MNKINWEKYVNHIFCLQYLQNDRLSKISKTLTDINIDINNPKFFSFIYDYEHNIFKNEFQKIKEDCSAFFYENSFYGAPKIDKDMAINNPYFYMYAFYIGLLTYRILKIAQYFNYERIIVFEDDLMFLKDINYIINAMDFVKEQDFDICLCQTTFVDAYHGIKSYLIEHGCEYLGNDMFLKVDNPFGIYGGGMCILTKRGINKIVNYYENNNLITALDSLDNLRDKINLNTLFALKPLCIQQNVIDEWPEQNRIDANINMIIEEYE